MTRIVLNVAYPGYLRDGWVRDLVKTPYAAVLLIGAVDDAHSIGHEVWHVRDLSGVGGAEDGTCVM